MQMSGDYNGKQNARLAAWNERRRMQKDASARVNGGVPRNVHAVVQNPNAEVRTDPGEVVLGPRGGVGPVIAADGPAADQEVDATGKGPLVVTRSNHALVYLSITQDCHVFLRL